MKKLLSKEIVEQAIATIKTAGDKPTIERIRKITGGSPKTIIAIKRLIYHSEHDNNNDNIPIPNDSKHDNILSSHDIKILIDTRINQQFELLKSELLSELKKSSFDSVSSDQINQTIVALKTENVELSNQLDKQAGLIQKLTTDKNQLVLKNKNKFETIERLQAEIKGLEEAKLSSYKRITEVEKERDEALVEVTKFASENTELRSEFEKNTALKKKANSSINEFETEPKNEPISPTEPESNESKNEPENEPEIKFTLDEAHERFLELRKEFPGKKQAELLNMLDAEGYKNSVGKKISPSNLSRWKNADKKAAKAGQK